MLQEMLKRCKKRKWIEIKRYNGYKYLSNHKAAVCMQPTAPDWTANDCLISMGVDDSEKEKFTIIEQDISEPSDEINVDSLVSLQRMQYSLNICGSTYQPFLLRDGKVMFVDMDCLAVFKDAGIKQYYYDEEAPDKVYVISSEFVIGIITASRLDLENLTMFTSILYDSIKRSKDEHYLDAGGQLEITDV